MEELNEEGNAFAISDLWKPSFFENLQIETGFLQTGKWDALNYGIELGEEFRSERDNIFKTSHCPEYALPDLSSFQYGHLEIPAAVECSSFSGSTDDSTEDAELVEEDPWSNVNLFIQSDKPSELKSWEFFYDKGFKNPRTAYVSEGGPLAFDAALRLHLHGNESSLNNCNEQVLKSMPMLRVCNTADDF